MAARLIRLCISSAVLGIALNEALPLTEESRLRAPHRFLQHPPNGVESQRRAENNDAVTSDSEGRSGSLPSAGNEGHASRGPARFGRLDSGPPPLAGSPPEGLKRVRKLVLRGRAGAVAGARKGPNDETGSDSSVLFIGPEEYGQALASGGLNGQEASAPYPPAVPAVQSAPYPPASRGASGEVPFVRTNSPDPESARIGVSYSPPFAPEERETPPGQSNRPESPDAEPSLSEVSYSLSAPPAVQERAGAADLATNALGSPDTEGAPRSPEPASAPTAVPDDEKVLDDDNRISAKRRDEAVRSPFLPNPDFFAFSPPPVDALGRLTGWPFGFGTGFNQEGTSIGDAAFIVPDDLAKDLEFELPKPEPPRETFGLTVDDGNSVRNELRRETGEYIQSLSTSDGQSRSEEGVLVPTEDGDRVMVVKGFYSYRSPEGLTVRVDYTSDQNGYRATPSITGAPKPKPAR